VYNKCHGYINAQSIDEWIYATETIIAYTSVPH